MLRKARGCVFGCQVEVAVLLPEDPKLCKFSVGELVSSLKASRRFWFGYFLGFAGQGPPTFQSESGSGPAGMPEKICDFWAKACLFWMMARLLGLKGLVAAGVDDGPKSCGCMLSVRSYPGGW